VLQGVTRECVLSWRILFEAMCRVAVSLSASLIILEFSRGATTSSFSFIVYTFNGVASTF
jgi:hypothetical protein